MIQVAEATALIRAHLRPWPHELVALDAAAGRCLAEAVRAERDQPPFDRVTMDGIAIAHAQWANGRRRFQSIGTQAAGAPALALAAPGDCVHVMTGTPCPRGADTVVPIERVVMDGDAAVLADTAVVTAGQFIHVRGSDQRSGDEVLAPGARLGAAEIAVLASVGKPRVLVARLPRVAAVSTGDELVGVDAPLEPFQIRSSNEFAIAASLRNAGLATVTRARLRDDPAQLLAGIRDLHAAHDVVILSGGVSMGEFDFVPAVLKTLGARIVFHRIEQKPGRPMWFGVSGEGKPIFALPGNPVSTLVCVTRYVLPALREAAGYAPPPLEEVRLTGPVAAPPKLTYFLPVKVHGYAAGTALAEPRPTNTSGDFASLAGTTGFVELPPGSPTRETGTLAPLYRW